MTSAERLRRSLARAGVQEIPADTPAGAGPLVVLKADWVFDDSLVRQLAETPDVALVSDQGDRVAALHGAADKAAAAAALLRQDAGPDAFAALGLRLLRAADLAGTFNNALRKRQPPLLAPLTADNVGSIEKRLFDGSYKGVTDAVTKYAWPWPARHVTKWCALAGITPNQVTLASLLFVLGAFWLFWNGQFLAGLALAWIMTFLDTVDGKLARVTLTSTRFGNVFDHGIDLVHPPFWWWAWIVGLEATGFALPHSGLVLAIVLVGYVLQRVQEGAFLALFGIEIHIWRRFDSRFRLITARRNSNLVLLTLGALAGRPDLGMLALAAWTAISLVIHGAQLVQALLARRHGPLASWLAE